MEKENVGEKLDQEKDQENKILAEESLENNETASEENITENNEIASEEDDLETLDTLKKELSENKDKLLRSLAESENTRKQMEKIRIETNKNYFQGKTENFYMYPGTQVLALINIGKRTISNYLLEPIFANFTRALSER